MAQLQCKYGFIETAPGDSIVSEALRFYGEWAERQLCVMRRFIEPQSVVADIGASIGTRTVAFARWVDHDGHVHAYEFRAEALPVLERNIASNHLAGTVTLHGAESGASMEALDTSNLPRLDFVHIDVPGAVAEVLRTATDTVARCRPVITLGGDAVSDADEILAWGDNRDYLIFGYVDYAFNPENYRHCKGNLFGDLQEALLILVPSEKAESLDLRDLRPLRSADEARNLVPLAPEAGSRDGTASLRGAAGKNATETLREALIAPDADSLPHTGVQRCVGDAVHIVVPFYKKEELVAQIFRSLNEIAGEIREIGGKVFFYNDSPDYAPLQEALDNCRFDDGAVEFQVVRNAANLGFIGTCNAAFAHAKGERADVILLNSDTIVFPGALREILEVAQCDPMIGFVSPRSNNATLATLPHSSLDCDVTPADGYTAFVKNSASLPRFSFVPTAVGFCLFVKWSVYSELGALDPIYGKGYNEENDLILRANRCGYRAVLANRAFVWHQGEQSFAESVQSKAAREAKNAPVLHSRYPEYLSLIYQYFNSPEYLAEDLLEYVDADAGRLTFAFDFSNFAAHFNGTFESGIKLLEAAVRTWPKYCHVAVYMDQTAWNFHGLSRLPGVRRLDVQDSSAKVTAIVRVGQPFDVKAVSRIVRRAPVIGIFMLDTISYDCGYLSLTFDAKIWRYVFEQIDVLFTNSRFTLDRIATRFRLGARVLQRVSRHSLDVSEYALPRERTAGAKPHLFVIGNHFSHKFVRPTVDAIAAAFPDRKVVAVGYGEEPSPYSNVQAYESGNLSNETFEKFYSDAEAVVFPSHYEGFGFPILHSLARKRPIYVRDSALYRELASNIQGAENIHYFCTLDELVADLRENGVSWVAPGNLGEQNGWDRSAVEVFHALEQARRTVSYGALVDRLRQLDQLLLASEASTVIPTVAKRIGLKVERTVDRVLKTPGVKPLALRSWRLVRRLRAKKR
jgi:GT2 family glycosyltransferase